MYFLLKTKSSTLLRLYFIFLTNTSCTLWRVYGHLHKSSPPLSFSLDPTTLQKHCRWGFCHLNRKGILCNLASYKEVWQCACLAPVQYSCCTLGESYYAALLEREGLVWRKESRADKKLQGVTQLGMICNSSDMPGHTSFTLEEEFALKSRNLLVSGSF